MTENEPSSTDLNTILAFYNKHKYVEAEKLAKSLLLKFPDNLFCLKMLGIIYGKLDRKEDALDINKKIVSMTKNDSEAYNNLGISLKNLGKIEDSISAFNQAIAFNSEYAIAYFNLSNVLQLKGKRSEALQANQKAVELGADTVEVYMLLGIKLYELDRFDEAIECYKRCISLDPENPESYFNLADCLSICGEFKDAQSNYERAIELKPDFFQSYNNLGNLFANHGRFEDAIITLQKAISIKSNSAKVHYNLSGLKKYVIKDDQFQLMENLYLDSTTSDDSRCYLAFALGKACEDIGDLDHAFIYYKDGNAIRNKQLQHNQKKDIDLFNKIKSSFLDIKKHLLQKQNIAMNQIPIFIVGMPRSGTTLVEQIISSHDQVAAGGELKFFTQYGAPIALGQSEINNNVLTNFRDSYLKNIAKICKDSLMITDKMHINFLYTGLITTALPEAKIIHVKRDPSATCWSNFTKCFPFDHENLAYAYSLNDIVKYYSQYRNLMRFFTDSLPNQIYELDYESLVINKEEEIKKLIQYLGLSWDENCLLPHNNKRSVRTASIRQVRKKIYQNSSKGWQKFKPFLNGVFDELY